MFRFTSILCFSIAVSSPTAAMEAKKIDTQHRKKSSQKFLELVPKLILAETNNQKCKDNEAKKKLYTTSSECRSEIINNNAPTKPIFKEEVVHIKQYGNLDHPELNEFNKSAEEGEFPISVITSSDFYFDSVRQLLLKRDEKISKIIEQLFSGAERGELEEVQTALDELSKAGIDGTKLTKIIDDQTQTAAGVARKFRYGVVAEFIEKIYGELVKEEQKLKEENEKLIEKKNIQKQERKLIKCKIKKINKKLKKWPNQRQAALNEIIEKHTQLILHAWANEKMKKIDHRIFSWQVFKAIASSSNFEKFKDTRLYLIRKHATDWDENFWSWLKISELFKPAGDIEDLASIDKVNFLEGITGKNPHMIYILMNKKIPLHQIAWDETGNIYLTKMFEDHLYWTIFDRDAIRESIVGIELY